MSAASPQVQVKPGTVHTRITRRGVLTVDSGLVHRQSRWERINDMPSLYPFSHLREAVMAGAKVFVSDLEKRGYKLLTPEADMLVCGPLQARDWSGAADGNFTAVGRQGGEHLIPDKCDFMLQAEFLSTKPWVAEVRLPEAS